MIKINSLSFNEQDVTECNDVSVLLNYEIELLKLMSHIKGTIDHCKELKEKGTPVAYDMYSKNIRFKSLLGILHAIIKNRIKEINKDNPKLAIKHFGNFFIDVAEEVLSEETFKHIKDKAEIIYRMQIK